MKCLKCNKGTLVFDRCIGDEYVGYTNVHKCDVCGEEEYLKKKHLLYEPWPNPKNDVLSNKYGNERC